MSSVHAVCKKFQWWLIVPYGGTTCNVAFKADRNRETSLISVLSSGYGRSDPEPGTVPYQSGATEGGGYYSTAGKPAAEGSPGHTEKRLLCTADIPGLDTHVHQVLKLD